MAGEGNRKPNEEERDEKSAVVEKPRDLSGLVDTLRRAIGARYVLTAPEDLSVYECDAETLDIALPELVVLPSSTEEVALVMKLAAKYGVPVSPRGAGTGLSGGATAIAGGISLALTRMTKILEVDPYDRLAIVQVGATNLSVSGAAAQHNLYFAPDPSSQIASTIGGNIAENAGGPHCLKYGMTTSHVLGMKMVLPNGETITLGGRGPNHLSIDLRGIVIGSEGTLGVVTEAVLRLIPRPQAIETMLAYFPTVGSCGQAVSDVIAEGVIPAAMEMIDQLTLNAVEDYLHMGLNREAAALLIVELDGPKAGIHAHREIVEKCARNNGVLDIKWAQDADERAKIWKARKTSFGALGRIRPHGYVLDGVIPRSKLAESIEKIAEIATRYNLTIANVYHAGDGNLHPCMLYHRDDADEVKRVVVAAREILEMCVELGGTLSGEHGIGIEKILEMPLVFNEDDLEAMGWVKETFDPLALCNPAKVLPTPKSCGESGRSLIRHQIISAC